MAVSTAWVSPWYVSPWYVIYFICIAWLITSVKGAWEEFNKAARSMYEEATAGLSKEEIQDLMEQWTNDIGHDGSMERVPLEIRMRKAAQEANRVVCIRQNSPYSSSDLRSFRPKQLLHRVI